MGSCLIYVEIICHLFQHNAIGYRVVFIGIKLGLVVKNFVDNYVHSDVCWFGQQCLKTAQRLIGVLSYFMITIAKHRDVGSG